MNPNILFLIIDSFRADKFYGKTKTSITPNLDNLIENSTFFNNAISASDATLLSWSSMFTGKYSFKTGIRSARFNKLNSNITTFFEIFQKNGYTFFGFLPTLSETIGLFPKFSNSNYLYDMHENLSSGLGEKILNQIKVSNPNPWFTCIHIMNLHFPISVSKKFNDPKYGDSTFDRAVSELDEWLGIFLDTINLDDTILVITADHGSYIQQSADLDINFEINPTTQKLISKFSKKTPNFLKPLKDNIFFKIEANRKQKKLKKIKNLNLTPHEQRALMAGRSDKDHFLFDDNVCIPLLFAGYKIPKKKIIHNQVRSVDIIPTLFDITEISSHLSIDGISLKPFLNDKSLDEEPAFIESTPMVLSESNDVIGIRTSSYKYFRDKDDPKKRVYLFDLKSDPFEDNNISNDNPDIVTNMEILLKKIYHKTSNVHMNDIAHDSDEIEDELRKLGYL